MNFLKKSGNKEKQFYFYLNKKFVEHGIPVVIGETGALQDKIEKSERIKWILFRR